MKDDAIGDREEEGENAPRGRATRCGDPSKVTRRRAADALAGEN